MAPAPVRLTCPICEAVVSDGAAPEPGRCPGCGARYAGDGASAPEGVAAGLRQLGVGEVGASELATALFSLPQERCQALGVAVTSDERDGFYRWWLFVADGGDPADRVRGLLAEFRT